MTREYKLPKSKLGLFIYHWCEWGFKLAWSMLTKPKQWEPVAIDWLDEPIPVPDPREGEQK